MKKTFLTFLMLSATVPLWAVDFVESGIAYRFYGNEVYVTYHASDQYGDDYYAGSVVIPSTVTRNEVTYNVTGIDPAAFAGCSKTIEVTIPESVVAIGEHAFRECTSLKKVNLPLLITELKTGTFYGCKSLESITIGANVASIGSGCFSECESLASIVCNAAIPPVATGAFDSYTATLTVPYGKKELYSADAVWGLFNNTEEGSPILNYKVTSNTTVEVISGDYGGNVVIPSEVVIKGKVYSVTSIGDKSFYNCIELTSVTISEGVRRIGLSAFEGCTGLTSVTIPNSVTSIVGSYTFLGCTGLTSIVVETGNTVYDSRDNCNAIIETSTNTLITGCKTTVIPNSVTSIGYAAFCECTGLTSITIPESVTRIGDYAFYKCPNLTSVTIPERVTSIGGYAFLGCTSLTYIELPSTITTIGGRAFAGYDKNFMGLTMKCKAKIPPTLGGDVFEYNNLTLEVPFESVSDYKAIKGWVKNTTSANYNIGSITYKSKDVDGIYYLATSKTEVEVISNPSKYTGEIVIPAEIIVDDKKYSVTRIGDNAFKDCNTLTSVTIPEGVTSIGIRAFQSCHKLSSITIPEGVTSIEEATFIQCIGLSSVIIHDSITSISRDAFNACTGLTSVTIGSSVTSIGFNAFYNCFFNRGDKALIECNALIPPTVDVGHGFFQSTSSIKVPFESVLAYKTANGWNQFINYVGYNIEGIYYLPISETEVEVVSNPLNYTGDVVIPAEITVNDKKYSVTSIGKKAFSNCTGLTSITIPNSVTGIGSEAFMNCSSLLLVDCNAVTPPTISSNSLPSSISLVLVPVGSSSAYKADEVWGLHNTKIIEKGSCDIEVTVKEGEDETLDDAIWFQTDATNAYITGLKVHGTLSQEDFELIKTNMTSLLNLDISDTDVTEIPAEIFKDKVTLMNVKLPNGLKSVGSYAFSGCKLLAGELIIPETVETIGDYAFQNCVSIEGELTIPASVKTIGDYAFKGCVKIDSLDMSNAISLESIEGRAFEGCTTLKKIKFSSVLRSISDYAFNNCKELGNFELPISLNSIGNYTFANCTSLTVLNLDDCKALSYIGNYAFNGCTSLKELNLEGCESLTSLYDYIFANCTSLENIKFPTSLETIGSYAFKNCNSIAMLDFAGCESLTSINSTAFNGCTGLTVLNMVDCTSLTTINSNSFSTCSSLKTVNFPSSLTSVGAKAFANCNQLKNISVPCDIPPTIDTGADPFYGVDNIECILTYPTSLMRDYYAANYWGSFIKRDVKTNIDVEVDNLENETEDGDTDRKPGHIWFDKDWHKHHAHHVNPIQPKSVGGIKLLAETTEPIVPTTDVSGIKGFVEDGLSMYVQNGDSVTFLIQPEAGYVIESVSYGGEDVTTQIVNGVFVTPAVSGKNIKLQVSFAKETANVLLGDVNGDSEVDVSDVMALANFILGKDVNDFNNSVADVNKDGTIDVSDVMALANKILGK